MFYWLPDAVKSLRTGDEKQCYMERYIHFVALFTQRQNTQRRDSYRDTFVVCQIDKDVILGMPFLEKMDIASTVAEH